MSRDKPEETSGDEGRRVERRAGSWSAPPSARARKSERARAPGPLRQGSASGGRVQAAGARRETSVRALRESSAGFVPSSQPPSHTRCAGDAPVGGKHSMA
eukprot:scaffold5588_cov364-Prasinococcus_capsulatus_cf.AAC.5